MAESQMSEASSEAIVPGVVYTFYSYKGGVGRSMAPVTFEMVGEIGNVETIAVGGRIRDIMGLRKQFGFGR